MESNVVTIADVAWVQSSWFVEKPETVMMTDAS